MLTLVALVGKTRMCVQDVSWGVRSWHCLAVCPKRSSGVHCDANTRTCGSGHTIAAVSGGGSVTGLAGTGFEGDEAGRENAWRVVVSVCLLVREWHIGAGTTLAAHEFAYLHQRLVLQQL